MAEMNNDLHTGLAAGPDFTDNTEIIEEDDSFGRESLKVN